MRVLGIDPGLRNTGWGVIVVDGPRLRHVANGVIHSSADKSTRDLAARLSVLFRGLCAVIAEHAPDAAAVEQTFVNKDASGTLKLGQARGIALLAVVFVAGNAVANGRGWLPGVHRISRRSWGTVVFPLALLAALVLCWGPLGTHVWAMQVAFAVLALADPAASWVGTRMRQPGRYRVGEAEKSVAGSLAFAVIAFGIVSSWLLTVGLGAPASVVLAAASVAMLATLAEALGRSGWDNLWIVLAALVALVWLASQVKGFTIPFLVEGAEDNKLVSSGSCVLLV